MSKKIGGKTFRALTKDELVLVDFVKQARVKGMTNTQITEELVNNGWSIDSITVVFQYLLQVKKLDAKHRRLSIESDEGTSKALASTGPQKRQMLPWREALIAVYALISVPICFVTLMGAMAYGGNPITVLADHIIVLSFIFFGPMMMMTALISVLIYAKTGRFKLASAFLLLPLINVFIIFLANPFATDHFRFF